MRHGHILFLSPDNIANIVRAISETGIIALGMTFVIITAGIDLSVGAAAGPVQRADGDDDGQFRLGHLPTLLAVLLAGTAFGAVQGAHLHPLPAGGVHRHARRPAGGARAGAGRVGQRLHQHLLRRRAGPRAAGVRGAGRAAVRQHRAGGDPGVPGARGGRDAGAEHHALRPLRVRGRRQRAGGAAVRHSGRARARSRSTPSPASCRRSPASCMPASSTSAAPTTAPATN